MTFNIGIPALLIHLGICAVFLALMYKGVLKVKPYVVPFIVFVPFWGCISVLMLHMHLKTHEGAASEIPMEKLRIDDEIYRSLAPEVNQEKNVAPLEEVLMFAPSETRRGMMLDILNDAPDHYTQVLLNARSGDDTEVVHYATTAMAEMSKKSDIELQHFENAYSENPADENLLREYSDYLEEYLKQGLAEGRTEKIQRNQLVKLLKIRSDREASPEISVRLIKQLMMLKSYEKAQDEIAEMQQLRPLDENSYLLEIECCALMHEGSRLRECIETARKRGVYFSRRGLEQIKFWMGSENQND